MAVVTMRQLLEAGIHFGHQTRRWHPKMARFIFGERNGIYIIDLQKTMRQLVRAYTLVRDTVAQGGVVLFVGTKRQAQETIKREALRCGMYYVNNRWLGGTLTNWQTIKSSIAKLNRIQELEDQGKINLYTKKEAAKMRKEREKLEKNLSGVREMPHRPNILFVIDVKNEDIAVAEARRLRIPCIGIVDTNCDPDVVDVPIPGNDDALRAINLFCSIVADAVIEGRMKAEKLREEHHKKDRQTDRDALARAEREAMAKDGRMTTLAA
ncbi:MAG TPA: 30S ribosomal protein S2, partial [Candidatus Hydrogenedentes bacterium]|nr:30S ribosomal protein S2 [Candidatus Hydrogenedentota bacterium]